MQHYSIAEAKNSLSRIVHEAEEGQVIHLTRRGKLEAYLNGFITSLPILPYDENAASWHSAEQLRLSNEGLTPAFIDAQIAAVAYV